MGWKWDNIAAEVQVIVDAKKQELATRLEGLARAEDELAVSPSRRPNSKDFHEGRAAAFREVRDAVKPKAA